MKTQRPKSSRPNAPLPLAALARDLAISARWSAIALLASCAPSSSRTAAADPAGPEPSAGLAQALQAHAETPVGALAALPLWDDGRAEVARYEAERTQYGIRRRFEATLISVKEAFDPIALVKSDTPGPGAIPVMKSHLVYTMPTENYDYQIAASAFVRRDQPMAPVKLSATSHEWCGITSKFLDLRASPTLEVRSYFGDEGSERRPLSWPPGGVTEEQLLFSVRSLPLAPNLSLPLRVLSPQTGSPAARSLWRDAELRVTDERTIRDASDVARNVWHLELTFAQGGAPLTYDVERSEERALIAHHAPGGLSLLLRDRARWAYWDRSIPSPFKGAR